MSVASTNTITSPPLKKIVIVGGSYGGMSVAHNLLKHTIPQLPDKSSYQVVITSASSQAMCRPATPRALISDDLLPQDKLFVSIPKQFEQYPKENFRFVHGKATDLDPSARTISVSTSLGDTMTLNYYALVIATGMATPSPLHGLNEDEIYLRESWQRFRRGLPKAKSIVIAGGGPAGIETAGELGEHLNGRAGWFSHELKHPKVNITVVTSGSQILPALRPSIAHKAEEYLAKVGVTVIKSMRVASVTPENAGIEDVAAKATVSLADGKTLDADLYIPATGTKPNTAWIPKDLLAEDGRVRTNGATLRVDNAGERVYAIGDVGSYSRPAVHLLLDAIPVVSKNIKRDIFLSAGVDKNSIPAEKTYKEDTRETQMVPVGRSYGVGSAMGYRLPSFLVWLIKGRDYWLWTTGGLWSGKQWAKEGS